MQLNNSYMQLTFPIVVYIPKNCYSLDDKNKTVQRKVINMYLVGERWFSGSLQAVFYNLGIIIWMASEVIIFALTKKEDKRRNESTTSDQLSVYAVIAGNVFSCLLALGTVRCFQAKISSGFAWLGIIVLYTGIFYRCYAVWTLKQFFTLTVKIKAEHKIIKKGPYAYLRHPAYMGSILSLLGMQLGIKSLLGLLLVLMTILLAYGFRIHIEEKALLYHFGQEYEAYQRETKKIIPFIL